MFAVRLRTFMEWHRSLGRVVDIVEPIDRASASVFRALAIDPDAGGGDDASDTVVPTTKLTDDHAVEDVAARTKEALEYQLHDVSALGEAAFNVVADLCGNAIEHGANDLGAFVAVRRIVEPRRMVVLSIGDLGIGIPEHLRRRYPELSDDGYAIARAIEPGVSGTGDRHRGYGYDWVFEKALTAAMHAATIQIHSLRGFFETDIVQERRTPNAYPAANYKRGTWISVDLISV